jgi:hypothetical protein
MHGTDLPLRYLPTMDTTEFSDSPRLRCLRQTKLDDGDRKLIADVEKYGCHIIHVSESSGIPGWSYTIGVYETLKQPELIVIGLSPDLSHFVLNEVVRLMRAGTQIENAIRIPDLLDQVVCEFRTPQQRWAAHVMNCASWFYGGEQFPVLQCIYPDLSNYLPWETAFDSSWRERQALLFLPSEHETKVERDFWAASDPNSSLSDWKFQDPPHTGVYTTKRIMNEEEPILYVSHDEDGAWQFHGASESKAESAGVTCFHHLVDSDPSLGQLHDLPTGWCAWRDSPEGPWTLEETDPDPSRC